MIARFGVRTTWLAVAIAVAVGAVVPAGPTRAADPSPEPGELTIGLAGICRTGSWTPVVVHDGAAVAVWAEDSDGQFVRSPAVMRPPSATAGTGSRASRFRVRFGRPQPRILIESSGPDGTAVFSERAPSPPLASAEQVVLVIGDLPAAERAVRLLAAEDGARPRLVVVAAPQDLAAGAPGMTPRDFDGIDAAIVCGSALEAAAPLARDAIEALDGWVREGGRLVFIAGATAALLSTDPPPDGCAAVATGWLPGPAGRPGRVDRLVPLRRAAAIETFGRVERPLDKSALAGFEVPLLADASSIDGVVEAFEGVRPTDLPLVVRFAHGFGAVTWIGIDLDKAAFRTWPGTDTLLTQLLVGRAAGRAASGRAGERRGDALDLAGQLRLAIDRYPGVAPIPFELVAGLGLLYVACLYPLDWWLVSRGGRPWLAWLSLPVAVVAFSGLAWGAARHWKGDRWQSSAASVTDVDLVSGRARGFSWTGIWSPVNTLFAVSAGPTAPPVDAGAPDVAVTWYGATGRAIGGPDAPAAHPSLAAGRYRYAAGLDTLEGVGIAAASSRLFEAEWSAPWSGPPALAATLEREAQGTLRGTVKNGLPFALDDCVLVHAGWLYDVGRLAPEGRFDPSSGRGPRSLAGELTRRQAVKDRDVPLPWDVTGTDTDRIIEVAGFHAAAGGASYTSLESGRLARLDLSPLLALDRAVLVGRGPAGTQWRDHPCVGGAGGRPREAAADGGAGLWRIVIPIGASRP